MTEYYKQEINLPGTKQKAYYRVKNFNNIDTDRLLSYISDTSNGISRGVAQGVIIALSQAIQRWLCLGHSVTINGLGTFSLSLALKDGKEMEALDEDEEHRNSQSIKVGGIKFRPAPSLLSNVNKEIRLERGEANTINRSQYTKEERLQRALDYLQSNPYLTVSVYRQLTGLAQTTATTELRALAADPSSGLAPQGRGSHKVYVKAKG